jgi:hypothetical protein
VREKSAGTRTGRRLGGRSLLLGVVLVAIVPPAGAQPAPGAPPSAPRARALQLERPARGPAGPAPSLAELRERLAGEPNPFLAFLPADARPDYEAWRRRVALEAVERRSRQGSRLASAAVVGVPESEPNDTPATANPVPGFGTGAGDDPAALLTGALASPIALGGSSSEDDGSIPLANQPALEAGAQVSVSAQIGDGPHGSSGSGSGDFDFYEIPIAYPGQVVQIVVETPGSPLDPILVVYDDLGNILTFDLGNGQSSALAVALSPAGSFFALVTSYATLVPTDPFDSGSGDGASGPGAEGSYDLTLTMLDSDLFAVELEAGDVLGVAASANVGLVTLHAPDESVLIGSPQDATSIFPAGSLLPGGAGGAAAHLVAPAAGTYTIELAYGVGAYTTDVAVFRPPLEEGQAGGRQTLFLDFDGAIVAPSLFGGDPGSVSLSPLGAFLAGWGLTPADEGDLIDSILATVEENLATDLAASGVNPLFDVEILNSRDHPDPFGVANVSRVIVGGTIGELGLSTIGIAQSIDPGNFEAAESAVVLLDLLSAASSDPNSLNQFPLAPGATRLDVVGRGVGNIVAHEAGHFLASFHTDQQNATPAIMDQGGLLSNTVGVGPDGIYGNGDDPDVDFVEDRFVANEGFFGLEDTQAATAFGLSISPPDVTVDPGSVLIGLVPGGQETVSLAIANLLGVATLEWSLAEHTGPGCASAGDVPWLSVTPAAGSVAAGGSVSVDLELDATGLPFDTYTASLCLTSNDPDTPALALPVEIVVSACGPLDLVLENDTVAGPVTFEACQSITARNGFTVGSGSVELIAPRVVLGAGFSVSDGASLTVTAP